MKDNLETFLEKFHKKFPDSKLDFSKAVYVNSMTPIIVICHEKDEFGKEHGEFPKCPNHLMQGQFCPRCVQPNKDYYKSASAFEEQANKVHKNKYLYPNLEQELKNAESKITYVCKECGHTDTQLAYNHILGRGCRVCAAKARGEEMKRKAADRAIANIKKIHAGGPLDLDTIDYQDNHNIGITCTALRKDGTPHGRYYRSYGYWKHSYGCPECGVAVRFKKRLDVVTIEELKSFLQKLGIKTKTKFVEYAKTHKDELKKLRIPINPKEVYERRGTWKSWGDLFGKERGKHVQWATFEEAMEFARSLGLKSKTEWLVYVRTHDIPVNIPKCPERTYAKLGWKGYPHFLGFSVKEIVTYVKAMEIVRGMGITKVEDYEAIPTETKFELGLPACPQHFYKEWSGWGMFFGDCKKFTKPYRLALLKSGDLEKMSPHQLIELAMSRVIPPEFKVLAYANGDQEHLSRLIRNLISEYESNHTEEENNTAIEQIEQEERRRRDTEVQRESVDNGLLSLVVQTPSNEPAQNTEQEIDQTYVLPSDSFSEFRMYDDLDNMKPGDKAAEFITEEEHSKLWNGMLYANEEGKAFDEYKRLKAMECGEFSSYVRDKFVAEYEIVTAIKEDADYRFDLDGEPCPLSLMQKLMAYKMSINNSYGNWCGTGAGKTNAFLFSTRYVGAKTNVVITPNGVISTLVKAIKRIYPNSNIVVPKSADDINPYSKDQYTYIIFNYEKFQDPTRAKSIINRLFETNTIDFVCLDEAHNIKVRDIKKASNRSKYINSLLITGRKINPLMKTLAMTATPCPNTLSEVRSIIEALTGKKYPEIGHRTGIDNIHNAYKALIVNGFRYVPKYPMVIKERVVEIDCTGDESLIEELRDRNNGNNDIAFILANRKLGVLKDELRDGVVVYSNWVDCMAGMLEEKIRSWGYKVECYNGTSGGKEERRDILEAFLNKKINVLVCSQPISTGVDGLQKRCNKMIFMSLPWTDVDYSQTKGRVYRQGSVFNEVEFVIPQVTITQSDGKVWSYDRGLYGIVETKRSLATAVLDGYIQDSYRFSHERLKQLAIEALEAGLEERKVERQDVEVDVDVDLQETEEQRKVRRENYVNGVHRLGNTSNHRTMHKYFSEHPDVFNNYHDSRDTEELAKKTVIPIADYINSHYTNKRIADLGCGVNMLSTLVKNGNTVTGFDHQRYKDHDEVVIADIADLSGLVKDREFDIAVFSLSLWAPDYEEYFNEAYRILSKNGIVFVVEPVSKFGEGEKFGTEEEFVDMVENYGFSRLGGVKNHQGFKFFRFEKED